MSELPKTFDPSSIETKWYRHWEETGAFRPHRPDAEPFTIVNPPPNVTGSLHMGHALDNTLQDILVRHARMQGKDALWVVGTDHAGIATQMVVERQMEAKQDKRTNYSREDFVDKVWEWKAESGGEITRQLRRLGCSMDWSREQFTMDPHFTKAVVKVFVDLYNQGLIYRDKRLVNWDPKLKTAISDLEVETVEVKGGFWHFRYPLADGVKLENGADHIVVATTRPETMLADMAVAVNAKDPRYQSVIGKHVVLPITGRRVPIIADDHADPELGSGAVKITPGHDFNDFEVGKRAGIKASDMLNMFDAEAKVVQTSDGLIPAEFIGMDRFDARKLVVERMTALGCLVPHIDKDGVEHEAEPRTIQTPFGDRGGVVIEPWLTDQWYVDAERLAVGPIAAVKDGRIEIVPKSWEKTWFNWMENIQPWCVSRQLWWGHRIPAWYGPKVDAPDERIAFVAESAPEALEIALNYYQSAHQLGEVLTLSVVTNDAEGQSLTASEAASVSEPARFKTFYIYQDPDVLDTWFSSALWPFATLGWPGEEPSPLAGEGRERGSVASATQQNLSAVGAESSGAQTRAAPSPQPLPRKGGGASLLARHYPNDVLISGFDILFFWDARMAMQGMHFMGEVPWKKLYLHGLVRAADGSKMSKSKGNTVDPLIMMDQYGTDALRFFMAAMESQGRDIKMDEKRVEGYRNFATKLWNAARFCQANGIGASHDVKAPEATLAVNKWIIGEVVETLGKLNRAFEELRFDGMADAIYHFAWGTFCDWYLELIKGQVDDETKTVAGWVFDQILVMLHPFMPFITEELWGSMGDRAGNLLIHAKWPEPGAHIDFDARDEIRWLIDTVSAVRGAKNEAGIAPGQRLTSHVADNAPIVGKYLEGCGQLLSRVGRLDVIYPDAAPPGAAMRVTIPLGTLVIPLEGTIDLEAERARLSKAIESASKEASSLASRLNNPAFVEKAKPEAVEKARADHAEKAAEVERLQAALSRLG